MLMVDRILEIFDSDGKYNKGKYWPSLILMMLVVLQMPFQRGSCNARMFGLDGLWQLVGFYLTWKGKWEKELWWGMLNLKGKLDRITKKF